MEDAIEGSHSGFDSTGHFNITGHGLRHRRKICAVYDDFNFNFALGFRLQIHTMLDDVLEVWFSATPFGISSWLLEGWFSATLVRSGAKPRSKRGNPIH